MLTKLFKKIRHYRRKDIAEDDYYYFSKKNRFMGFVVELFDPLTFALSAPEVILAIVGIFGALGIASPFLIGGFFALEVLLFSAIALFMGYKYLKESKEVNETVDRIKELKQSIEVSEKEIVNTRNKITALKQALLSSGTVEEQKLKKLREELEFALALRKAEKQQIANLTPKIKPKLSSWQKTKKFWKNHIEKPYYKFKKKHPMIVGGLHYAFNFVLALLAISGVVSGVGYFFGVSATSLGLVSALGLTIGFSSPMGLGLLIGVGLIMAAVFMGRRMFFHSPVSRVKQRIPERKKELERQYHDIKQTLDLNIQELEALEKLADDNNVQRPDHANSNSVTTAQQSSRVLDDNRPTHMIGLPVTFQQEEARLRAKQGAKAKEPEVTSVRVCCP